MNRRQFIGGIGAFFVLPGAGRLWKAVKPDPVCMVRFREGEGIQRLRVSEMTPEQKSLLEEHRRKIFDLFDDGPPKIGHILAADIPMFHELWQAHGPQVERVGVWGWS